jgi:hypothetical protein
MTSAPIIFPDVELVITTYLREALAQYGYPDIFVSNRRETQTQAVWVRRDGGPALDVVREAARVGINVFDATEQKVANLALTVSALMRVAADGEPIVRVEQTSGPSPIADATPRRYLTFEVVTRGTELAPIP